MKASEFIDQLRDAENIETVIGPYRDDCGAWIRLNPLDGKGQSDRNVAVYRHVLIESDTLPKEEQERIYRKYELPITCLVDSAGKSVHALVRIDAPNEQEYRNRVNYLFRFLEQRGFPVDNSNKNPSRLSRMPGVTRNGVTQELLATHIGKHTWSEWLEYAEELALLPEPIRLSDVETPPPKPPELIRGILRRGHKMLIAGPSKAGKSFLLIELAIAIAEGSTWLGFSCAQGRVLYVNLEIDPASCIDRFITIYGKLGFSTPHSDNIVIWNLRGHALPLDRLVPILVRRMKDEQFAAVIIDPIYKVITGDENNASDMGAFCNQFDKICTEMGASAIYCHHHSKGAQGGKKAMDRASGSGVFARDPDAQLDVIELKRPLFKEVETETRTVRWSRSSSLIPCGRHGGWKRRCASFRQSRRSISTSTIRCTQWTQKARWRLFDRRAALLGIWTAVPSVQRLKSESVDWMKRLKQRLKMNPSRSRLWPRSRMSLRIPCGDT